MNSEFDLYQTISYVIVGVFLVYYIVYPGGKKTWFKRKKQIEDHKKQKKS